MRGCLEGFLKEQGGFAVMLRQYIDGSYKRMSEIKIVKGENIPHMQLAKSSSPNSRPRMQTD
jgi:hypothetical protein